MQAGGRRLASRRGDEGAFEREPGVLPVDEPAGIAPYVAVATLDEVAIQGDARQAVDVRAVDDDLVVGPDGGVELLRRVEMQRARDVLGLEGPSIEGHDQLDRLASIELCLQVTPTDDPDRLAAEGCGRSRLIGRVVRR